MSQPVVNPINSPHPSRWAGVERLFVVPHIPEALATVRRHARTTLTSWGLSRETTDEALLVVSELVSNAVLHALPPADLRLSRHWDAVGGTLRIEVADAGPAPTCRADERRPDEHGRGIAIVAVLSACHGTRCTPDGSIWWAELPIPRCLPH